MLSRYSGQMRERPKGFLDGVRKQATIASSRVAYLRRGYGLEVHRSILPHMSP